MKIAIGFTILTVIENITLNFCIENCKTKLSWDLQKLHHGDGNLFWHGHIWVREITILWPLQVFNSLLNHT